MSLATHRTPHLKLARPRSVIEPLEARIAPAAVVQVSGLNGQKGFKIIGANGSDPYVNAQSESAGDFNGDGFDDIVVTALGETTPSATYLIFGKAGGFGTIDLAKLNGANGFKIGNSQSSITSASSVGDINGDGFSDLAIASGTFFNNTVTVLYGRSGVFVPSIDLATVDPASRLVIEGAGLPNAEVSNIGDFDGDGIGDILIGAPNDGQGAAYLIYGSSSFGDVIHLSALDGSDGFKIDGDNGTYLQASQAGDLNGDGKADIVISDVVSARIVFGHARDSNGIFSLSSLDGTNGFRIQRGSGSILSASGIGDFNGDGYSDLIVTAGDYSSDDYAERIIFGKSGGFDASLNADDQFYIGSTNQHRQVGQHVTGIGDLNGDGITDIMLEGIRFTPNSQKDNLSFIVFGRLGYGVTDSSIDLGSLHQWKGFLITGGAGGSAPAGMGDINGDGLSDAAFTSYTSSSPDVGDSLVPTIHVVFGHATKHPIAISDDGHTATYRDVNGGLVTVKVSNGQLTKGDFSFDQQGELTLNLLRQEFTGANVSIIGQKNELLTVKAINAQGVDLGNVSVGELLQTATPLGEPYRFYVGGVLEEINAGSGKFDASGKAMVGVSSLTLLALGNSADDESHILGSLGALAVTGEVSYGSGDDATKVGSLQGTLDTIGTGASILHASIWSLDGLIRAEGNIGNVTIHYDVRGGSELSGIIAGGKLGLVKVGGSIVGDEASNPVIISALGNLGAKTAAGAVAIAGIRVAGDVTNAEFLAGYNAKLGAANPNASIGKIKVGGNWTASSVVAGVADTSTAGDLVSAPDGFSQHDSLIAGDTTLVARIASITINGTATGSSAAGAFYGLTAQQVGAVSIEGVALALTTGADDLGLDDVNGNFRLVEVAA